MLWNKAWQDGAETPVRASFGTTADVACYTDGGTHRTDGWSPATIRPAIGSTGADN